MDIVLVVSVRARYLAHELLPRSDIRMITLGDALEGAQQKRDVSLRVLETQRGVFDV